MKKFLIGLGVFLFWPMATGFCEGLASPSTVQGWVKVLDTPQSLTETATNDHEVYSLLEHKGLLYIGYYTAGLPNHKRAARLYTWDGTTQTLKYTFGTGLAFASVQALGEYQGNLFAGISGLSAGDGDIYMSRDGGTTWTKSFNSTTDYFCSAFKVFKGKLYAGMGYWGNRILAFDGTSWTVSYPGTRGLGLIEWMVVYKGRLYAAVGGGQAGAASLVYTEDGINWTIDSAFKLAATIYSETAALVEFKGKLYAGMLKGGTTGGDILVYNDATGQWSLVWSNPFGNRIHALEVYNGRLYVGNANMAGAGDVYVSEDGINFVKDLDTDEREVFRLYPYNGSLYMGAGFTAGQAKIWRKNDAVSLRLALRQLWEAEGFYARGFLIPQLNSSLETSEAESRWLKNLEEMSSAIASIYPNASQNDLNGLLREHQTIAKALIQAVSVNNETQKQALLGQWKVNGENFINYLSGLNIHTPKDELKSLWDKHQAYVVTQAVSRVASNWSADLQSSDLDRFYLRQFADRLVDAYFNQF